MFVDLVGPQHGGRGACRTCRAAHKDTGWRLFVRTIVARAYPRVIGQQRQMAWMFSNLLPLLGLSRLRLRLPRHRAPEEFVGFVILGGAMSAFWLNVLWAMANQLYMGKADRQPAPVHHGAQLADGHPARHGVGGMLGDRAAGGGDPGARQLAVRRAVPCQRRLGAGRVFALGLTALYGMGMMCASLFLLLRAARLAPRARGAGAGLPASGLYFPVNTLPVWVAIGASVIPLTLALDAMRQCVRVRTADGLASGRRSRLALAGAAFVFTAAARSCSPTWNISRVTEGRLTETHG